MNCKYSDYIPPPNNINNSKDESKDNISIEKVNKSKNKITKTQKNKKSSNYELVSILNVEEDKILIYKLNLLIFR